MITRVSLIVGLLLCAAPTWAQQKSIVGGTHARITDRVVIGGATFGEVLRIIGSPTTSSGNGTINPMVIDADGDVLEESNATISTGGAWSFGNSVSVGTDLVVGNTGSFGGLVLFSGNVRVTNTTPTIDIRDSDAATDTKFARITANGGTTSFQYLNDSNSGAVDALTFVRSGTTPGLATFAAGAAFKNATALSLAALGFDNLRVGVNTGTPRVIFEDTAGSFQIQQDNDAGTWRIARILNTGNCDTEGCLPLQVGGNIFVQPLGRRILPVEPYGVDLGSQQYKFGAIWTGDFYADRIVTIENIGTIDNRWLIGNGNVLDEDLAPSGTTMVTRYNNYATGTFVYLQKFGRTEFIKTSSGPTLTNKITNGSFETGAATNWAGTSATVSAVTTKSFHGEYSMLVDASANPSFAAFGGFGFTTGTTYTACLNVRRVDGAAMADGAVSIYMRDTFVDVPAQSTQTDGWYRFCRTAAAGSSLTTVLSIGTKGVDMYVDSVQVEADTSRQRPYSEYRASYTITRNEEGGSSVANQWYAGDGMFGVGKNTGDGWIDCYAIRGIKSATEQGPACVVNVRTGSSFNSWGPRAIWGNMDGLYGYSGTTYGFAAGDSSAAWIAFDSTNGIRGMSGATKKFGITMAGVASFVEGAVTIDNAGLRITNATSSTGENLAYTFTGGITYIKRPGLFYSESAGTGELALSAGDRSSGVTNLGLSAAVGNVNLAGIHVTVTTVGGSFWMNGSPGFSGTKVMGSCTVTMNNGVTTNVTGC